MHNKLVIVTDAWHKQINGVVRTLEHTIDHLTRKGFDVSVIEPSGFRTIPCPTYPEIPLSWNIWRVGGMITQANPDYLHISTEGPLGVAAKIWADRRAIAYTTSYHTRYPEYFLEYFGGGLALGYKAIRWFHGRSRAIMVNTPRMRDLLAQHGLCRTVLWDRGVDTDLFRPEGATPSLYETLPRPILLNVGRVATEKNLAAFYELAMPGSKVQVGTGPVLDKYKALYPDVHFVGARSGEELAAFYRGADLFVFPSKSDTYGLVMLESIASGVPVAAYPVDGPNDVLIEGVTGSLHDDLRIAATMARPLRSSDLHDWALTKSWSACTDAFIAGLVPVAGSC
jgi:glycosyltransferase involved in cell wall biosynthesis